MSNSVPIIRKRDLAGLVRQFLLTTDAVSALVEDRIRSAHVVDPDLGTVTYPMVIIDVETGVAGYQGGIQRCSADIYAYSDQSQDEADQVYDAVYLALQAARLWDPSGVINAAGTAREVERPEPGYNENTRAWFGRGTWVMMVAG